MSHSDTPESPTNWERPGLVRRLIRPALALLVIAFVALAGRDLATKWHGADLHVSMFSALASLVPLVVGTLGLALSWKLLIERMAGARVRTGGAMALHVSSQLGRYVPGKVGVPVIRMAGASRLGVATAAVGASVMVETLSLMAVGATFSFGMLALTSEHAEGVMALLGRWSVPLVALFGLGTLVLVLVDRRRFPRALLRVLRTEGEGPLVPPVVLLAHLCYWALWAVHGYIVSRAVGAHHSAALASTGLYSLAPVAGFIVLVAPAGVGVREAVLSIGLTPVVGPAGALAAALISRGVSVVGDVATWLCLRPFATRAQSARPVVEEDVSRLDNPHESAQIAPRTVSRGGKPNRCDEQ